MKHMKDFTLDSVILDAKKMGSYFITVTTKDRTKIEGALKHYAFKQRFVPDDIILSVDRALRSMKITPQPPVQVVEPPKPRVQKKPLKIAIVTHFNRCPDSFSPGKAVRNQIKMLQQFGHEVVFFVVEGSKLDAGCEMRPVVTRFPRRKNIIDEEAKKKFVEVLKKELVGFDIAITHDFYIDDCITYREAIKECGVDIPWIHWARSGVGHAIDFKMPNARYIYMNYSDAGYFASRIGIKHEEVRVVFNEKDPSLLFDWHPVTKMISDKMRLWEKNIMQTYPICTTRMDAKGLDSVIRVFGILKSLGNKVALIVCNSNGRRRIQEIENKIKYAEECGLINEQDFVLTSTLSNKEYNIVTEVPHKVVIDLLQISNLFVFPTLAEVCSNILLEASMNKNLIVINEDLPSLEDFVNKKAVLRYPFTSLRSIHYTGKGDKDFEQLAKDIVIRLKENWADRQFRKTWKTHSFENIYYNMLEPILYEKSKK